MLSASVSVITFNSRIIRVPRKLHAYPIPCISHTSQNVSHSFGRPSFTLTISRSPNQELRHAKWSTVGGTGCMFARIYSVHPILNWNDTHAVAASFGAIYEFQIYSNGITCSCFTLFCSGNVDDASRCQINEMKIHAPSTFHPRTKNFIARSTDFGGQTKVLWKRAIDIEAGRSYAKGWARVSWR